MPRSLGCARRNRCVRSYRGRTGSLNSISNRRATFVTIASVPTSREGPLRGFLRGEMRQRWRLSWRRTSHRSRGACSWWQSQPSTAPSSAAPPSVAPRPSDSQPAPGANGVVDPGGEIAVEATRPGLTRVGAAKCGMCHKPQYASWSESAHAKRKPPLDCENCHGAGSE